MTTDKNKIAVFSLVDLDHNGKEIAADKAAYDQYVATCELCDQYGNCNDIAIRFVSKRSTNGIGRKKYYISACADCIEKL